MTTVRETPTVRLPAAPGDPHALRAAFARIPQSVAGICALGDSGHPIGLVVSTLTMVSLNPPLALICVQAGSRTWSEMRSAPCIGVSVFAAAQEEVSRSLAARGTRRFENVDYQVADSSAVLVCGAVMWMECVRESETQVGDHQVAVLSIKSLSTLAEREPLVFHMSRYRKLDAGWPGP